MDAVLIDLVKDISSDLITNLMRELLMGGRGLRAALILSLEFGCETPKQTPKEVWSKSGGLILLRHLDPNSQRLVGKTGSSEGRGPMGSMEQGISTL